MISFLRKRPMLISAVGCIFSALCGFYSLKALVGCFILTACCFVAASFKKNTNIAVALFIILVMSASCFFTLCKIAGLQKNCDTVVSAELCVLDTDYSGDSYYRTEFEVFESTKLPKGTKLALWHASVKLKKGQVIKAKIRLEGIEKDYKASSYANGVYIDGSIIEYRHTAKTDKILSFIEGLRNYIKTTLFNNMSYSAASTVSALVFGDRSYFTDEFYENVKAAGVAHVMVVSGMHLSVLVGLCIKITEKFIYNSYLKSLIMFLVVVALCGVCGFTNSILRAGVTFVIMAAGISMNRPYSGDNALGAAVSLILIFSPFTVLDIGFQLSVLATFGILALAMPLCRACENLKLKGLLQSIIISLSALLLTLPVTIGTFGYVSCVSVITNLLISLPVSFCLCITSAALILNPVIPFFASVLLNLADLVAGYINFVINHFGGLQYSTVKIGKWGVWASVFLILSVFSIMLACKKRKDMIKLDLINQKLISERGVNKKWQSFLRKP